MGFDATGGKLYKGNQDGPIWYGIVGFVVLVCFVGVILGPKLFGSKKADIDKTIPELVAGQSLPDAAGLINAYGFQDELTKSVLVKMQQIDQTEHAKLLTDMARQAQAGRSKNDLSMMILQKSKHLAKKHKTSMFLSEVAYFDQALLLISELSLDQQAMGGKSCDLSSLYRISQNKDLAPKYMYYDSKYYQYAMRTVLLMLGAIEGGIVAPQNYGELTTEDTQILSPLIVQMAANPESLQFFNLLSTPEPAQSAELNEEVQTPENKFDGINGCEQVDILVASFQTLPDDTRARFWAAGLTEPVS